MASISFTKEEEFKLKEFRSRVHLIYSEPDEILVTWLRARDLNVDRAEQMLRRHLIWRKNNQIDTLKNWIPPKCFFPVLHAGHDLDGCPIFLLPIGRWELRASIENGDIVPALRYIYQYLEKVISACRDAGVYQGKDVEAFAIHLTPSQFQREFQWEGESLDVVLYSRTKIINPRFQPWFQR